MCLQLETTYIFSQEPTWEKVVDVFHMGIWTGLRSSGLSQVWKRSEAGNRRLTWHCAAIRRLSPDGKGKVWGLLPPWVVYCRGKTQLPQEGVNISRKSCAAPLLKSVGSSNRVNQ